MSFKMPVPFGQLPLNLLTKTKTNPFWSEPVFFTKDSQLKIKLICDNMMLDKIQTV